MERVDEPADAPRVAVVVLAAGAERGRELLAIDGELLVALAPPAAAEVVDNEQVADEDAAAPLAADEGVVERAAARLAAPLGVEIAGVVADATARIDKPGLQSDEIRALVLDGERGAPAERHPPVAVIHIASGPLVRRHAERERGVRLLVDGAAKEVAERREDAGRSLAVPVRAEDGVPRRVRVVGLDPRVELANASRAVQVEDHGRVTRLDLERGVLDADVARGLRVLAACVPGARDLEECPPLPGRDRQAERLELPVLGVELVADLVVMGRRFTRPAVLVENDGGNLARLGERDRHVAVRSRVLAPEHDLALPHERAAERLDVAAEELVEVELVRRLRVAVEVQADDALRVGRPDAEDAAGSFELGHDAFLRFLVDADVLAGVAVRTPIEVLACVRVVLRGPVVARGLRAGDARLEQGQAIEVDELVQEVGQIADFRRLRSRGNKQDEQQDAQPLHSSFLP